MYSEGTLPSPYAVYKFCDNEDHDTDIAVDSSSPQFNDVKLYTIPVIQSLHDYICSGVRTTLNLLLLQTHKYKWFLSKIVVHTLKYVKS